MATNELIAFKKWRLKMLLRWCGSLIVAGAIIPLAVFVGGMWIPLAEIMLPMAFGFMIALDIKNGATAIKNKNS